ncbi:MAG: hypothetical protein DCF16_08435 [Alphaproteobacteria bacterium]|nr:MAG: hypothetical protein DCF16_08435 [Alphaproteobacteria bacterium]
MVRRAEYSGIVRHVLLTLLTAFALAASGLASASSFACPMAVEPAASAHDCCPDEGGDKNQPLEQHDMDGCMMGMACRTAPAMASSVAPIALSSATIVTSAPVASEPANLSGPLQQLFRPPRTI